MEILLLIGHGGHLIVLLLALLIIILPVIALIDILRNEFNGNDKIIYVLIVLLLPFLGSIFYFIFGTSKKISK